MNMMSTPRSMMTSPDLDLPRYTRWDQVPADLYTRTQLAKLTPPRKITKDTPVRGRVLYLGNRYTDLFHIADTMIKPPPTPAQQAAMAKASQAQYVCRRCGGEEPVRLGKGRLCRRCRRIQAAWRNHVDASQAMQRVLACCAERGTLVIDARPTRAVILGYTPDEVDQGTAPGLVEELGWSNSQAQEALVQMNRAVTRWMREHLAQDEELPEVLSWGQTRPQLTRMSDEPEDDYRWLDVFSAGSIDNPIRYGRWHVLNRPWPNYRSQMRADATEYIGPSVSLDWELTMPGTSGDIVADTREILPLVRRIADRTEPTGDRAPWIVHPSLASWDGE